jgi:hypothetical protein
LTILIEEQFTAGVGTDEADQLEFAGDLIRHIEGKSFGRKLIQGVVIRAPWLLAAPPYLPTRAFNHRRMFSARVHNHHKLPA